MYYILKKIQQLFYVIRQQEVKFIILVAPNLRYQETLIYFKDYIEYKQIPLMDFPSVQD